MKNEATDEMFDRSTSSPGAPAATRSSSPAMYASMTSAYRSRLKISVTLIDRPSPIRVRMAGTPSAVAGTLM